MGNKEEKLFIREFFRKAGKAIYDYNMIEEGEKILVGVSGGKDSLALLEVLTLRARDPKKHYTVVGCSYCRRKCRLRNRSYIYSGIMRPFGGRINCKNGQYGSKGKFRKAGLFCMFLE